MGLALLLMPVACAQRIPLRQALGALRPATTPTSAGQDGKGDGTAQSTVPRARGTAIGQLAPELNLASLDGQAVELSAYHGQVVLLNFWATWCGPCRAEIPELIATHERYKDQGFTVLAVNLGESVERVEPFAAHYGVSFPILLDPSAQTRRIYPSRGIPTSFLLDREGVVRQVLIGAADEQTLAGLIEPLL